MTTQRLTVLKQAMEAIDGQRDLEYGSPEDNFERIAVFWQQYTGHIFTGHDVAVMMILLKVSRLMNNPAVMDNWVDIAGYAACGAEVSK